MIKFSNGWQPVIQNTGSNIGDLGYA